MGCGYDRRLYWVAFKELKKAAIYKSVNAQSQPTGKVFDVALVKETKTNIGLLEELIVELAHVHQNSLKALFTTRQQTSA
jgi:hypothetical protein